MLRHRLSILLGLLLIDSGSAGAQEIVDRSELKVCADPNNLPFSNEQKDGFENKIAELMGKELGLAVDYAWFPQVIGFVHNTLRAVFSNPPRKFGPSSPSPRALCKWP